MIATSASRRQVVAPGERLRFAIPKGALFTDSIRVLEQIGIDTGELSGAGRQLVIGIGDFELIVGKPSDIPIYVASGAADVGIAGKDVLVELGLDVVEMVDLGFGGCRVVVAEPENAQASIEEQYAHLGVIRVATKYPRIAESYFAGRGLQVEIVKLSGNIEIAPLIGIADRIVDIVQTGTTLRENQLKIVDEVMESSARFIANPASLRTRAARVTDVARRLAEASLQ